MAKDNKSAGIKDVAGLFRQIDTSDFPAFDNYNKPLEMSLWILWVAKEKPQIKRLRSDEISSILREVMEISVTAESITRAFARAGERIYSSHSDGKVYFEIMKPGKEYLQSLIGEGEVQAFYFEPGKKYTNKKLLAENILCRLTGELRIVDPYCGARTLDVLRNITDRPVRFLTKIENLRQNLRMQFLRELKDFQSENPNIEFRDYPHEDIHDRYIISSSSLVILGYSIKDLGNKESFAVVLDGDTSIDIVKTLICNFDKRWIQSHSL